jgi:hypothetical protein
VALDSGIVTPVYAAPTTLKALLHGEIKITNLILMMATPQQHLPRHKLLLHLLHLNTTMEQANQTRIT